MTRHYKFTIPECGNDSSGHAAKEALRILHKDWAASLAEDVPFSELIPSLDRTIAALQTYRRSAIGVVRITRRISFREFETLAAMSPSDSLTLEIPLNDLDQNAPDPIEDLLFNVTFGPDIEKLPTILGFYPIEGTQDVTYYSVTLDPSPTISGNINARRFVRIDYHCDESDPEMPATVFVEVERTTRPEAIPALAYNQHGISPHQIITCNPGQLYDILGKPFPA